MARPEWNGIVQSITDDCEEWYYKNYYYCNKARKQMENPEAYECKKDKCNGYWYISSKINN